MSAGSGVAPGIAIFDFDDTLVAGDSMPRFLEALLGVVPARWAMVGAVVRALAGHALGRPAGVDFPGSVKAELLGSTLAGVAVADAHAAAHRLRPRLVWLERQLQALRSHAAAGRRIVVVSGALDVDLPILLEGRPVDDILATTLECRDGRLTGRLAGVNCVRRAKAECIKAFLAGHAPTGPSWGYGNRPHDLPMLELVDHPTVI